MQASHGDDSEKDRQADRHSCASMLDPVAGQIVVAPIALSLRDTRNRPRIAGPSGARDRGLTRGRASELVGGTSSAGWACAWSRERGGRKGADDSTV
jgi:hypothetical protein